MHDGDARGHDGVSGDTGGGGESHGVNREIVQRRGELVRVGVGDEEGAGGKVVAIGFKGPFR